MADLFDRFTGSSGLLTSHTSDDGSAWGPTSTQLHINGSGSAYSPSPPSPTCDIVGISAWTPPSANYAVSVVFGAGFRTTTGDSGLGCALRISGTDQDNWSGYFAYIDVGTPDVLKISRLVCVSTTISAPTGMTPVNLGTQIAAGDALTATITGSTPTVTAFINGVQVAQWTETGTPITAANGAGMIISEPSANANLDVIRTIWAGAIGGPTALGISPTTATLALSGTKSFTVSPVFTNETFSWTATHGTVSGSAATETYTAPGSGGSDTVTSTSVDLPTRTVSASILLPSQAVNHRKGPARRRKPVEKRLDFPIRARS